MPRGLRSDALGPQRKHLHTTTPTVDGDSNSLSSEEAKEPYADITGASSQLDTDNMMSIMTTVAPAQVESDAAASAPATTNPTSSAPAITADDESPALPARSPVTTPAPPSTAVEVAAEPTALPPMEARTSNTPSDQGAAAPPPLNSGPSTPVSSRIGGTATGSAAMRHQLMASRYKDLQVEHVAECCASTILEGLSLSQQQLGCVWPGRGRDVSDARVCSQHSQGVCRHRNFRD